MSTIEVEQIIVFDDQQVIAESHGQVPKKGQQMIMVLDSDLSQDGEELKSQEDSLADKQNQQSTMSKQQYRKRCSKIEDMIIMQNFSNLGEVKKPQKNYFKEVKQRRATLEAAKTKRTSRNMSQIIFQPKAGEVKVDFESSSPKPSNNKANNYDKMDLIEQKLQFSMNEELVSFDNSSIGMKKKQIQKQFALKGAMVEKKVQLKIQQDKDKSQLKVSNFRQFLYTQLKPNYNIYILIKRTNNGLINSTYKFYFQQNRKFILSCQKQGFSTYVFSTSEVHISQSHISYLGKMQSSFFGGQFLLYDSGQDCDKTKMMQNYKRQLAYINYTKQQNEPRKIQTLITACDNKSTDFTVVDKEVNVIQKKWKSGCKKNITRVVSKDPSYDPTQCCFKMDFKGLAGIPSIKNCILQNQQNPDALIFGRRQKQQYLMRVRAPFSIIQAAAVAMSSIHYKFL